MGGKKKKQQKTENQTATPKELTGKEYAKELAQLHVELVRLQEWVKHKGLKVCIVFEGRDGAGKGGTIKAITERVSPRVFRVVALPAPDRAGEEPDVHPALPAAPSGGRRGGDLRPELVQPRRRRAGHGVLQRGGSEEVPARRCRSVEKAIVDSGIICIKYWLEVSPEEQTAAGVAHRRRAQDLEALPHGSPVVQPLVRLLPGPRRHVRGHRHRLRALARGPVGRQASGPAQHHRPHAGQIPYKKAPREKVKLPERQKPGGYKEPDYPYKYIEERY